MLCTSAILADLQTRPWNQKWTFAKGLCRTQTLPQYLRDLHAWWRLECSDLCNPYLRIQWTKFHIKRLAGLGSGQSLGQG